MTKRKRARDSAARPLRQRPATAAAALGTAITLGLGSVVLLMMMEDRTMRRVARRVVKPDAIPALRNHFSIPRRRPAAARMTVGGIATTAGMAAAFIALDTILNHGATVKWDHHLHRVFRQHRDRTREKIVTATTIAGSPAFVVPLSAAIVFTLLRKDRVREGVALIWTEIAMSVLAATVKNIVRRNRPPEGEKDKDEFSFPSGHTLLATSSYGLMAYFLANDDRLGKWRIAAASSFVLLIPWTAFSRMYLGMHWPSDTLAAVALGAAWDASVITFLRTLA